MEIIYTTHILTALLNHSNKPTTIVQIYLNSILLPMYDEKWFWNNFGMISK